MKTRKQWKKHRITVKAAGRTIRSATVENLFLHGRFVGTEDPDETVIEISVKDLFSHAHKKQTRQ